MKIETIKDLRELLKANDNHIEIGGLVIKQANDQSDIDIEVEGNLVLWINNSVDADEKLADVYFTSNGVCTKDKHKDLSGKIKGLERDLEKAKEQEKVALERVEIARQEYKDYHQLKGQLEVFEKLFVGRKISAQDNE